jgi:hypothetical protein
VLKKANLHNKKLRDCRTHLDEPPNKNKEELDRVSKPKAPFLSLKVIVQAVVLLNARNVEHSGCV